VGKAGCGQPGVVDTDHPAAPRKVGPELRVGTRSAQVAQCGPQAGRGVITCRKRRVKVRVVIADLNQFIRGWLPVYGRGLSQALKRRLNRWIIRRIKAWLLKQWRKPKTKIKNLKRLSLDHEEAMKLGNSRKRLWRISGHYQLNFAMPQKLFIQSYGLVVLR